jgi:hypothetical protein
MTKQNTHNFFRILTGFIATYHLLLGICGIFLDAARMGFIVQLTYGVVPSLDPQFIYMTKFISVYFLVVAALAFFITVNPVKYAKLAWILIGLFIVRIIDRLVFFDALTQAFGITMAHNIITLIPITLLAIGLIAFMPKATTN